MTAGTPLPKKSIKQVLKTSYLFIILLLCFPIFYVIFISWIAIYRYDNIITNVSKANTINQIIKVDIADELWSIVAGNKLFKDGTQYQILNNVKNGILEMQSATQVSTNLNYLEVASRAIQTLERYVDRLGLQIETGAPVVENEAVLDEVRSVASVVSEVLQDFIVAEIESGAKTNEDIKTIQMLFMIIQGVITLIMVIIVVKTLVFISESIRRPIHDMESLSSRIASGDFAARVQIPDIEELDNLAKNLNMMAGKIQELVDENIREQQSLKKAEMKTLQAQITPHFLYNTFDTIIWLAESEETEKVIEITRAFSGFFRISLSRGREWITVAQELEHIRYYLQIQKIRYSNILDYTIDFDDAVTDCMMLKLTLQPLVENAIYHGIKNKRGMGIIKVTAFFDEESAGEKRIHFRVEDNGIGFTQEKLDNVLQELACNKDPESLSYVYGLYNVNKRLNLYYGESVKLEIKSEFGKGTCISFSIPYVTSREGFEDV